MIDKLLAIEATAKTRTEAQRRRTEDAKGIVAATYTEWADALVDLGQPDEADRPVLFFLSLFSELHHA